jgi:NAD(P)H-dependent FMN reductase
LISGSSRQGSTNTALLRTARSVPVEGVETVCYEGVSQLPHFNPDDDTDPLHPEVAALRASIAEADALLFCTPEYAGGLPGSFKNLLDWTVGGGEIYRKPVGWMNASGFTDGAANAHASLQLVLGYVGATIVPAACVRIPVPRAAVGPEGLIDDPDIRAHVATTLAALAAHLDSEG